VNTGRLLEGIVKKLKDNDELQSSDELHIFISVCRESKDVEYNGGISNSDRRTKKPQVLQAQYISKS